MDAITELAHINYGYIFISLCVALVGIKFITGLLEWVFDSLGLETKWTRKKKEEHELLIKTSGGLEVLQSEHEKLVNQYIQHDNEIRSGMLKLSDKVDTLADAMKDMKDTQDKDKRSEYKDRIGQSYRYYKARKYSEDEPIPYWNHMEKEAMIGLIQGYESHNGKNSFVHSVVEPECLTWKLVD